MKDNNKVIIADQLLVGRGKSSRLAAMAKSAGQKNNLDHLGKNSYQPILKSALKPETKEALQQAAKVINQRINEILDSFPGHKRNSYFKLRYGIEVAAVENMMVKDIFAVLKLNLETPQYFKRIENLDLSGNKVS